MNFTSLRPYLEKGKSPQETIPADSVAETVPAAIPSGWRTIAHALLASTKEHVLGAVEDVPFRQRFEAVPVPTVDHVEETLAATLVSQYSTVFREYRVSLEERHKEREEATQSLFALIKESLLTLSTGSTRATGSFSKIEESLKKASTSRNIVELKAQIGEMIQFVQKEVERETREHERALHSLNHRFAAVKQSTPIALSKTPGRQDALEAARQIPSFENLWTVVVGIQQLEAIRSRYGDQAVAELLQEVTGLKDKILASRARAFQWSPGSVIFLVETYRDFVGFQDDLKSCLPASFEFKLFVGARLATLNVRLSWRHFSPRSPNFVESADKFASELV